MLELKGSRIDPKKMIPDEVGRKLLSKAASMIETKKLTEMQGEAITSALFLGAAIALEATR